MALIREIKPVDKERESVHGETTCSSTILTTRGERYLQLDTYGSKNRKFPNKVSQSLQFDEAAAGQLLRLIQKAFPGLRTE